MIFFKKKAPEKTFYTDCNIPARLFYHIMHTDDFESTGGEDNFYKIFDEYVGLVPSPQLITYLRKQQRINSLQLRIKGITTCLYAITYLPLGDRLSAFVEQLNAYEDVRPKFNISKPRIDEIERIQKRVLGSLKTSLKSELSDIEKKNESQINAFEQNKLAFSRILETNIPRDVNLYEWAEIEKAVKIEIQNRKKHGKARSA